MLSLELPTLLKTLYQAILTPSVKLGPKSVDREQVAILLFMPPHCLMIGSVVRLYKRGWPLKIKHQVVELSCIRIAKVASQSRKKFHEYYDC